MREKKPQLMVDLAACIEQTLQNLADGPALDMTLDSGTPGRQLMAQSCIALKGKKTQIISPEHRVRLLLPYLEAPLEMQLQSTVLWQPVCGVKGPALPCLWFISTHRSLM